MNNYATSDMGLASFLLARGYPLVKKYGKTANGRTVVWFEFSTRDSLPDDVADYMSGTNDLVSASAFNSAARSITRMIRDERDGR